MHVVYVACLFGGALATAILALLGAAGGAGHGGHAHGGHGGHGGHGAAGHSGHSGSAHAGHSHAANGHAHGAHPLQHLILHTWMSTTATWTLSWLSPVTLAGAALWFGGIGLIAEGAVGPLALVPAIVAALLGALLLRTVMQALVRAGVAPLVSGSEGALATVNAAIRPDAPGEVIYTLEGLTRSAPARSLDGIFIPRGVAVAIVRRERGMAWVTPIDSLEGAELDAALELRSRGEQSSVEAGLDTTDDSQQGGA